MSPRNLHTAAVYVASRNFFSNKTLSCTCQGATKVVELRGTKLELDTAQPQLVFIVYLKMKILETFCAFSGSENQEKRGVWVLWSPNELLHVQKVHQVQISHPVLQRVVLQQSPCTEDTPDNNNQEVPGVQLQQAVISLTILVTRLIVIRSH